MTTSAVLPRPDVAPPRPWAFPANRKVVLSNGLAVVAYDLPGKRIAAFTLLLGLGQETEPKGLEGLGQVTISALKEGTSAYDAQAFAAARNRIAASYRASCGSSVASITMSVAATQLAPALDLLAEAVLRPTFPAAEVDRLVNERLDGITNELSNPSSRAGIELAKVFYAASSRRSIPDGGTAESVARIDSAAVKSFYLQRVDPATSILIVAGDLSGLSLEALVSERFGDWVPSGRPAAPAVAAELTGAAKVVVVDRPGSVQTHLLLAAPAPAKLDPDLPSVWVSANALGGGTDSRIMAVLREEKGYTYGISAGVNSDPSHGRFVVSGAVQTEVTGPAVEDLLGILRDYVDGGIREDERIPAVEMLAGRAPLQYETPQAIVGAAAGIFADGLPEDHVDRQHAAVRATTVDGINAAFARGVALDQAVLIAVGDGSVITESLRGTGLGDVTVVPA